MQSYIRIKAAVPNKRTAGTQQPGPVICLILADARGGKGYLIRSLFMIRKHWISLAFLAT